MKQIYRSVNWWNLKPMVWFNVFTLIQPQGLWTDLALNIIVFAFFTIEYKRLWKSKYDLNNLSYVS